jgi:hypothetical protein
MGIAGTVEEEVSLVEGMVFKTRSTISCCRASNSRAICRSTKVNDFSLAFLGVVIIAVSVKKFTATQVAVGV